MNRVEHLLSKVGEECAEIAQRAAKAAQFGLSEVQPGPDNKGGHNNAERINHEFNDLLGVLELLQKELHGWQVGMTDRARIDAKKAKVEKYLLYAAECGTLTPQYVNGGSE